MAFLHAYVHYFDVDTYLVLLTSNADAFFHLKDCWIRIETVLLKSNVRSEIQRSLLEGGMRVEDLPVYPSTRSVSLFHLNEPRLVTGPQERLHEAFVGIGGPAGLWHFIYRSMYLHQYVSSEFSSPISGQQQQKRLYRACQKLYASMHDKGTGPHKTQFKRNENYVLLCWVTQEFELYAAFDPLADKICSLHQSCCLRWIKSSPSTQLHLLMFYFPSIRSGHKDMQPHVPVGERCGERNLSGGRKPFRLVIYLPGLSCMPSIINLNQILSLFL